jgi:two-component system LytT family response regulator
MIPGPRYSVLVVDDEPLARQRIRQLLSAAPDFDVVGECADGSAVEGAVRELRPDLVFLDIKMIHADGFAAQAAIRDAVRHVVFVTAYPEHATRAFDVAALDYLVKPLTTERFNAALDRVRRSGGTADATPRIFLGTQQGGVSVPIAEISWVEADGAYVVVHASGKRHVLRESLAEMLERLGGGRFARIHRSAIVNLDRVRATRRVREGLEIELVDGTRVPVSRRRARQLISRLSDGLPIAR